MSRMHGLLAVAALAAIGCSDSTEPSAGAQHVTLDAAAVSGGAAATGGGHYDTPALHVQFAFSAIVHPNGRASGRFHHSALESDGSTVDVDGEVTCVTFDAVNHRAWIGGVITRNGSTDVTLQTEIHQPGRDVWFRVLDGGEGDDATDRSTFLGFTGAAGFPTSAAYCAGQPWPADNARTWPVTGNVSVRP